MQEILATIATMSNVWNVMDCFTEAYHELLATGRIKPDGPVCRALAEHCGITNHPRGDEIRRDNAGRDATEG